MDINQLTYGEIKTLQETFIPGLKTNALHAPQDHPYHVGEKYFIRTVTFYHLGELAWVGDKELVLRAGTASWIPDTGRFHKAMKDGVFAEAEPFDKNQDVIIGRGSIIDATIWNHSLILEAK